MTDNNTQEINEIVVEEQPEPKSTTMAETEEQPQQHEAEPQHETKKPEKMSNISFSIWPPTQRTRDAVMSRLIETLSTPSVLSKRYGSLPNDEATEIACRIEDEAFTAAGASVSADDDGLEILQVYSKEISKRMLDAVKSRSVAKDGNNVSESPDLAPAPTASEEVSSIETE